MDTSYGQNNHLLPQSHMKSRVGDDVRISKMKHMFVKGYQGNWSYEIFPVVKVLPRNPPVFKIKDYDGEEIEGLFNSKEL